MVRGALPGIAAVARPAAGSNGGKVPAPHPRDQAQQSLEARSSNRESLIRDDTLAESSIEPSPAPAALGEIHALRGSEIRRGEAWCGGQVLITDAD